jgi:hypothetical protein
LLANQGRARIALYQIKLEKDREVSQMRIDDFLNQSINSSVLARKPRPADSASAAATAPAPRQDTVTFSKAAQAFRDNNAKAPDRAPLAEYKALMDKMLGRGQTKGKTPEERIKEINEEIRKLRNKLSEVMSDPSIPGATSTAKAINVQIKALEVQLSELAQQISEESSDSAAA